MSSRKPRCSALNSRGKPCNASPIQPEGLCFGHHPKADEWRKKGGRPRSQKRATLPTPTPVSDLINDSALSPLLRNMEEIMAQVHSEDLDPDRARAMVSVTNTMMKIIDKANEYPAPKPEPERSDDHPFSWMFNDPPAWFIDARERAQTMVETHERQLETDQEYREQWLRHEEERIQGEEDFHYAMTKAVQTLDDIDDSRYTGDYFYEDVARDTMLNTFKQSIAERESERRQADPIPV